MCLQSLILTLGGLGEFSKVIQTLDYISGMHDCMSKILSTLLVLDEAM